MSFVRVWAPALIAPQRQQLCQRFSRALPPPFHPSRVVGFKSFYTSPRTNMPNKYTESHKPEVRQGPGDARPTAMQIVEDEGLVGGMKDKVFLVTGVSSGIGIETAKAVAATGAKCWLGARNLSKAEAALSSILEPGRVELIEIDVASLSSVRSAAQKFLAQSGGKLNVLINNAAIMACPEAKTVDGFESQFGTNYLGHFLLYKLVEDALVSSSTPAFNSRIINVASSGHHASSVILNNINLEGEYDPWKAYGNSKTAMIWMTNEIERRLGSKGVHGLSLMPGGIDTGLQKHIPDDVKAGWAKDDNVTKYMKSPGQGASTTLYAAVGKEWEGKGGLYLEDCDNAIPTPEGGDGAVGYKPHAFDPENEPKLWDLSLKLLKLEA